jgi:hypothetical protein
VAEKSKRLRTGRKGRKGKKVLELSLGLASAALATIVTGRRGVAGGEEGRGVERGVIVGRALHPPSK